MLPVYLIIFFSFFDTHAQMPVLAPYANTLGATPFMLGLVVGAYSFFNITGNFSSGIWIDRVNWMPPLFTGLIGVSLILALYPQAGSITGLDIDSRRSWLHGRDFGPCCPGLPDKKKRL
jgi:MFS family permease